MYFIKFQQRLYPTKMKETALRRQGRVCYIDGKPLIMKDAEAAHIKAHSKGGFTTQKILQWSENVIIVKWAHKTYIGG